MDLSHSSLSSVEMDDNEAVCIRHLLASLFCVRHADTQLFRASFTPTRTVLSV